MKRLTAIIIYFPALMFWVPFVITWKLANKVCEFPGSHYWRWLGVEALCFKLRGNYEKTI